MSTPLQRRFNRPLPDLADKALLVTGGTGSFGGAFVRKVLAGKPPRRLVVFSRDEQKQNSMAQALAVEFPQFAGQIRFFIGDVRDVSRLEMAMRGIDYVIHAAAMKIVPTAEYNPFECVLTNIHGSENVVAAALRTGVKKVISLSTDKAASPANLYGATKLVADKIMVAANNLSGAGGARFAVVRYGNVIGSRGSVVPYFRELIAAGASALPITDPRMTRFWISLDQGTDFVLSSLEMMQGGEIFVPKIPAMKIVDLVRAIHPDIPHTVAGIRPGEKLHEVMITEDDARSTVELDDRYVVLPPIAGWRNLLIEQMGAKAVAEGFHYSSEKNDEVLDVSVLRDLI